VIAKHRFFATLFIIATLITDTLAQAAITPGTEELLWDTVKAGQSQNDPQFKPTLVSYPVTGAKANGMAVLICPGGGYVGLADSYEGTDVAKRFNTYGISAFVVKYRRAPGFSYPVPINDGRRAMRIIRSRAKQLGIDTNKIGIMGFSAGGHLAATITTHNDAGNKSASDSVDRFSCKPAFAILLYPVISMVDSITHQGSRTNLIGANPDSALVNYLSNELQVNASTPPSFLVHTVDDNVVRILNSQLYYSACVKNKVTAKFMSFPHGPHGFGMADGNNGAANQADLAVWPDSVNQWLRRNFLTGTSVVKNQSAIENKTDNNFSDFSVILKNGHVWNVNGIKIHRVN